MQFKLVNNTETNRDSMDIGSGTSSRETLTLGIVVPFFNEQESVETFHQELMEVVNALPHDIGIYYVDDGSTDTTSELLERIAADDPRVTVIELSRNFGHQSALTAGLNLASGDAVITMDGDGQHPPALLLEMVRLFEDGYEIVMTQRVNERGLSVFKRFTSRAFYWLINRLGNTQIQPGSADFRLHSRSVVDAINEMGDYHRFIRGMVAWVGFKTVILPYTPAQRIGGQSKYSFATMARLSMDAIFSFSLVPLRIGILLGVFFLFLALLETAYVLSFWIAGREDQLVPGWSSLMFVILIVGGFLMIVLGFVGIYVGYIFQQVKDRPSYIIRRTFSAGSKPVGASEQELEIKES